MRVRVIRAFSRVIRAPSRVIMVRLVNKARGESSSVGIQLF
jgi:hypothetical protein